MAFQIITAIVGNENLTVLLDGEYLFPVLSKYLDPKWSYLDIYHLSFAAIYNLIRLNSNRILNLIAADGVAGLEKYFFSIHNKDTQKANLTLSLLYSIGFITDQQDKFIEQGGLKCILLKVDQADHVLVFLMKFINVETKREILEMVMQHKKVIDELETPGSSIKRKGLLAMLLRSIALHKDTSHYVLSKLAPYEKESDFNINEILIGIISNLVVTNSDSLNFDKEIIKSGRMKHIFNNLSKSVGTNVDNDSNMKDLWLCIVQILTQSTTSNFAWDESTVTALIEFAYQCRAYIGKTIYFAQTLSKFISKFSLTNVMPKLKGCQISSGRYTALVDFEKSSYVDKSFAPKDSIFYDEENLSSYFASSGPISITWQRASSLFGTATLFEEEMSATSVVQGILDNNTLAVVLSAIAQVSGTFIKTLFDSCKSNMYDIKLFNETNKSWSLVSVDDFLPCYIFGRPVGVFSTGKSYWQCIIEKAIAKHCGSYAKTRTLSLEEIGLLLTGKIFDEYIIKSDMDSKSIHDKVHDLVLTKTLAIFKTKTKSFILIDTVYMDENKSLTLYDPDAFDRRIGYIETQGIVKMAYSDVLKEGNSVLFAKL